MLKQRAKAVMLLVVATIIGYFVYVSSLPGGTHPFRLGLDLSSGSYLVFNADVSKLAATDIADSMSALRDDVERRVNILGVSEPLVQIETPTALSSKESAYKLIVELPGVTDPDEAAKVIGATPKLEFRVATAVDRKAHEAKISSYTSTTTQEADFIALFKPTDLNGSMVGRASLAFDQTTGAPQVGLNFNSDGRKLFSEITKSHIGDYIGIFLDDHLIQFPVVREEIPNGQAVISGGFTLVEAQAVVRNLNFGALPVPISILSVKTIVYYRVLFDCIMISARSTV
jgi:protein-export membrane protein SecD